MLEMCNGEISNRMANNEKNANVALKQLMKIVKNGSSERINERRIKQYQ